MRVSTAKSISVNRGFSLVELLVAMALGLAMSAVLVNMYVSSKRNYTQDDEIARMQENARYVLRVLSRELSMSGFLGGMIKSSHITAQAVGTDCVDVGGGSNWALSPTNFIELVNDYSGGSVETTEGTVFTCITASDLATSSDVISIKRTADRKTLDNGVLISGSAENNQWYLRVADYGVTADFRYLTSGIPEGDISANNLIDYWEYYTNIFFVRNYTVTAGDGIPSLCIASLASNSMTTSCYVEGVQNIQLEFGIDSKNSDQQADYFVANPTAAEMESAVAVRIFVLMRSVETISGYTNDKEYLLGSTPINPNAGNPQPFNDGYYRRVFSTTINLRNPVRL